MGLYTGILFIEQFIEQLSVLFVNVCLPLFVNSDAQISNKTNECDNDEWI